MNESTILLVGVGGIGFRHFQSLTEIRLKTKLILVDVNQEALEKAKEYYHTISNDNISLEYNMSLDNIPNNIDVAIIATSSMVRRSIIEDLLKKTTVKYMVFEKFLFPQKVDYYAVGSLLKTNNIQAYVNCPCRMYPGYIELKNKLQGKKHIDVVVTGSNWGLSCNAIHAIDILDFIVDAAEEELFCAGELLDDKIIESKRENYVEYTGRLVGNIGKKVNFVIESMDSGEKPYSIYIYTDDAIYLVCEGNQSLDVFNNFDNKGIERVEFPIIYQSRLTSVFVERLINSGKCDLTTFDRSCELHMPLLNVFLEKLNVGKEEKTELCPIT